MRYMVAHVINSPAGSVHTARLVISDVPDKTSAADVMQALTDAGRAGEFSEAGVPFGNHEIKAEGRRGWPAGIGGISEAPVMQWARLITPPARNDGRRITLRLTPAEFDRVNLTAQRSGKSLQTWCLDTLLAAAPGTAQAASSGPATSPVARKTRQAAADAVALGEQVQVVDAKASAR